jgi:hypothetical protein
LHQGCSSVRATHCGDEFSNGRLILASLIAAASLRPNEQFFNRLLLRGRTRSRSLTDVIRVGYKQRRQKQTLHTTPALPSRDAIRICCSILFQWNTPFLAPIVGKKFRWFSTSPFAVKSMSKTAKSAATQSRSVTAYKTMRSLASTPRYSNRFVLERNPWQRDGLENWLSRYSEERAIAIGQRRDKRWVHRASSGATCASDSGVFFTASATRARRERFRETRSASIDARSFSSSHCVTLSRKAQKRKALGCAKPNSIRPWWAGHNRSIPTCAL